WGGSCLIWGMGITQHVNGIHNAHALLNLSLVTGQLGRPGSGISPLRGQNNVQGCGDAGCIPTNLPGYQTYAPETLALFERAWGVRPPAEPGLTVTDMVEAWLDGRIRAMYVVGENPLLSEPDLHHAEKALAQLDVIVVQDLFLHETAEHAHVFLPAAAFAEKEGTFTNSERRVQRVRQALPPPGEARPDWWIAGELATRVPRRPGLGLDRQFDCGGALTRRVAGLLALAPRLEVAIHPADARRLGIADGAPVRVASRRGELTGWAQLTDAVRPGAVFVPFVKLADSAANFLTNSAVDPASKIPEYKVCAVTVEAVPAPARPPGLR